MKATRIALVAALLTWTAILPGRASTWRDEELKIVKQLGELATEYAKASDAVSPFTKALARAVGSVKSSLKTLTDQTLINPEDIEKLDTERRAMDDVMPPVLPSLNERGAYRKIVGKTSEPGTFQSGIAELDKLDAAGKERAKTIAEMGKNRDSLKTVADRYKEQANLGHELGQKYEKLLEENPMIDTAFVFTGVNGYFSLSVVAWQAEIVPALNERATASERAVQRYDRAIKAAEDDLRTFESLKMDMHRAYGDVTALNSQTLNPAAIDINPGAVGKAHGEAIGAVAQARAVSDALQAEARDIAKRNASISRVQRFTGLMRSAAEIGAAVTQTPPTTNINTNTTINDDRKIYFRVVPGEYMQQDRRGQTVIQESVDQIQK